MFAEFRIRLATAWMNEEWYNDQIRMSIDPDWVSLVGTVPFATTPDRIYGPSDRTMTFGSIK